MRIGIDASRYNLKSGTGVEHYSVKIIQGIVEHFKQSARHQIVLYSPRQLSLYKAGPIKHRVIPFKRLWTKIRLSLEMLTNKPDILFVPSHVLPYFAPTKSIITIHDVAFMHQKKAYSWFQYLYLKLAAKHAVKKASAIIVPSKATKADLKHFFKCPEEKIRVIPHGNDFAVKNLDSKFEEEVLGKMTLTKTDSYFLFVGRLETKKNIKRLIKAFLHFREKNEHFKLVLAGMRGTGFKQILKAALKLDVFEHVIMPGYVTEHEKHVLLKHCSAFVFPSLYEGFGIPILEAFTYEKPVLTAHTSSIPEVAGDGAIYCDPHSIGSIAKGLESIFDNNELVTRTIRKQKDILGQFTWDHTISETIKVLLG